MFFYKGKEIIIKEKSFKIYGLVKGKELVSHPRFIIFNIDFGVKANVAYGADFIFLKDSNSEEKSKLLFKDIISIITE